MADQEIKPLGAGRQKLIISIIFFTVVVDMMGFGVAFPILPVIFSSDSTYFAGKVNMVNLSILYGFLQASFAVAQFFGAPILGALSDRFGRKKIITISLLGSILGYLLFALGIYQRDILMMFIGRIIPGFAGGNISIVYSALADISTGQDKVKNFGLVGMAFGLGMIAGPVVGGLLSSPDIVSWFNFSTPFLFAAILSVINLVLLIFFFPETLKHLSHVKISMLTGITNLGKAFKHPRLNLVFWVVLINASGFAFFTQFIQFFFIERFNYDQGDIGLIFGYVGLWAIVTQGLLIRPIANFLLPQKVVAIAIPGIAISIGVMLLPHEAIWLFVILPFVTAFQGLYLPNMTAIVSNLSKKQEQGEMLGINQSLLSVSNAVPPIIGGFVLAISVTVPVWITVGCTVLGWLVFLGFRYRESQRNT